MKVGDYVRIKNEGIVKCYSEVFYEPSVDIEIAVYPEVEGIWVDKEHTNYIETKDMVKSSPSIIDLIEVGDYVNGREVRDVYDLGFGKCFCFKNEYGRHYDKTYKIKSIVTKEQFEQMSYKVGE